MTEIINLREKTNYLEEYAKLCIEEWGTFSNCDELDKKISLKVNKILSNDDKAISILGLINNKTLIGFISLFKTDGEERLDLTPWYATMYVKKEFRGLNYSKILNNAILKEAKN